MFTYDKKLQFPVKISRSNPQLAKFIITQYGGPYIIWYIIGGTSGFARISGSYKGQAYRRQGSHWPDKNRPPGLCTTDNITVNFYTASMDKRKK